MANLIGYVQGYKKDGGYSSQRASRIGHGAIVSRLETWRGAVEVSLDADGSFSVSIGPKSGSGKAVLQGNVNESRAVWLGANDEGMVVR